MTIPSTAFKQFWTVNTLKIAYYMLTKKRQLESIDGLLIYREAKKYRKANLKCLMRFE